MATCDARVQHHDVEPPAVLEGRFDQAPELVRARGVGLVERASLVEHLGDGRATLARVAPHVADDDEGTLVCEAERDRAPETRRTARDDGSPARETSSHGCVAYELPTQRTPMSRMRPFC